MGRWRESRGVRCRREGRSSIECMFDLGGLAAVDPDADEAALIGRIAWLEQAKSAAAAGQARAAAALDEKRRAEEAAAGVPKAKQCRGLARYRSTAPPLPGAPMVAVSEVEVRIGVALAHLHAA
jgi:hypothetical protein